MRAIETRYAGCHFRSRLEARWAVVFDALDIEWEYEPQGFDLPSGWYLPDFWLPDVRHYNSRERGIWIEIKGERPTDLEKARLGELAVDSARFAACLFGSVPRLEVVDSGSLAARGFLVGCDPTLVAGGVDPDRMPATRAIPWQLLLGMTEDPRRLAAAFDAGRSARFEHGESGAT